MAQTTKILLTDDLDGSPADETIEFGLDGVQFVIDLTSEHALALRGSLAPFVASARKQGGSVARQKAKRNGSNGAGSVDPAAVRAWAAENGLEVSERGRIGKEVMGKYLAANTGHLV